MVGETDSANLPMRGIVQVAPGRWRFLYRYTACSRMRREITMVATVYSHEYEEERGADRKEDTRKEWRASAREVEEATDAETERSMVCSDEGRRESAFLFISSMTPSLSFFSANHSPLFPASGPPPLSAITALLRLWPASWVNPLLLPTSKALTSFALSLTLDPSSLASCFTCTQVN